MAPAAASDGWGATLDLEVVRLGERSVLGARRHSGPLRVQRVFHPEGPVAHVYLLHPPGGVVGGDRLTITVAVTAGAEALVTTPAAQKLYRSPLHTSTQVTTLAVQNGASLEWLPGETLVFAGARASQQVRVELERGARFAGWDIGCFGRPASGEAFTSGSLRVGFEIWKEGAPLLTDRQHVCGGSASLASGWGYSALPSWGTLYAVAENADAARRVCSALRVALSSERHERVAVTAADTVVVLRVQAASVERVRAPLELAWKALRPAIFGRPAVTPRIWAT